MADYSISPRAYLERARTQLALNTPESLFYAAFELRCGIGARLTQYLEAHKEVEEKKRTDWNVRRLQSTVEETFKTGDQIAQVELLNPNTQVVIASFYYTPVKQVEKHRVRLDRLLHHMKRYRKPSDKWWKEQRQWLAEVEHDLALATTGALLGPMLWDPKTGEAHIWSEVIDREALDAARARMGGVGAKVHVRVEYLDQLPTSAQV